MSRISVNYKSIPPIDQVLSVSEEFSINKYISAILIQRFGYNLDVIEKFLNLSSNDLQDPLLMCGMNEGIFQLHEVIKNKGKILIYGDYDVDGITSVSVLYNFLQENFLLGDRLIYKTASRFDEGYGLSFEAVEYSIDNCVNLIICVDCGTKDYEPIKYAFENNIQVIVIDHHEFGDGFNCALIINPKNKDCRYPDKDLSGCGVVFKFIKAYSKIFSISCDLDKYFDLLALSICCDLVPVVGENRYFLIKGLEKINNNPQFGLKCLINSLRLDSVCVDDILFRIGPVLNAPGRIDSSSSICVDLFTSPDLGCIDLILKKINSKCAVRKELCVVSMKKISGMIDVSNAYKPVVVYDNSLNLGILGILASKCIEKKNVPSVVMTDKSDDLIVGSVRSVDGVDVVKILDQCSCCFKKYGGHKMAAGFLLYKSKLDDFIFNFNSLVESELKNRCFEDFVDVDIKVPLSCLKDDFYDSLCKIAPFGIMNESPVFESVVVFIGCIQKFNDTLCKMLDAKNNIIFGIIKNRNIDVIGEKRIIYKFSMKNVKVLYMLNIIDV